MTPAKVDAAPPLGLRERKKARTRLGIQQHALRLFREQGFHATTVEQVAEAAEVAPSTVFRYFPTKEALLVLDDYYSFGARISEELDAQPAGSGAVDAFRGALRATFASLSADDRNGMSERDLSILLVPEVLSANLALVTDAADVVARLVAARTGRDHDDPAVRAVTAALVGSCIDTVLRWASDRDGDLPTRLDTALAVLEPGLPL